jgi:uncharacterized repeat protein (TIGR03803 family)
MGQRLKAAVWAITARCFALNTNGTGFRTLHSFNFSDGAGPSAGLILSGNTLYGTASGGSSGNGTVFAVDTDGVGFTNLHSFTGPPFTGPPITNSDGAFPQAGLLLLGNVLYGTASQGGSSGSGTVFALNTNGTGFTNLHSFTAGTGSFPQIINSDGANPKAGLLLIGSTLYGTAYDGGSSGLGTMFVVNTDGSGFTNLHTFNYSDGINPAAGLLLSGNTLYGTAYNGGGFLDGTMFSLSLGSASAPAPTLTLFRSGVNVVLTWPTNAAGFTLQSTTNLVSPAVWITNFPAPVVVNGQNVVTNPASGTKKFYRLSQ